MIQGLLFDLDGTLVDSNWVWKNIGRDFLIAQGKTPEEGLVGKFEEMSFTQSAEYMIREYGLSMTVGEVIAAVTQMAAKTYFTRVELKPGAAELLRRCKAAGYPMAVGTALDEGLARRLLERLGILDFFRGVYTCETLGFPKTDPAFYRRAVELLGCLPGETAVFEDAPHALKTAKAAAAPSASPTLGAPPAGRRQKNTATVSSKAWRSFWIRSMGENSSQKYRKEVVPVCIKCFPLQGRIAAAAQASRQTSKPSPPTACTP